jgi:hypothetical protein
VADADDADPVLAGAGDGEHAGPLGEHLADAVTAVQQHQGTGVGEDDRIGPDPHRAGAQPRHVAGQAQHAVRLVSPEVGLHQAVGDQCGVVVRDADAAVRAVVDSGVRTRDLGGSATTSGFTAAVVAELSR